MEYASGGELFDLLTEEIVFYNYLMQIALLFLSFYFIA